MHFWIYTDLLIQESRPPEGTRDIWCTWKSKTRIWIYQETEIVDWNSKAKIRVASEWKATETFKYIFHIKTDDGGSRIQEL